MRIVSFVISAIVTIILIIVLNVQLPVGTGKTPRLGYFLSPQKGFWQNAEDTTDGFDDKLKFDELHGNTTVFFDDRLVPHIYADNDNDAYFVEGYLHAKFRLWQMEFQTYAAAGRLSEIMGAESNGTNFLNIDKYFRRLGMVYGAEQSLKAMEADAETKAACDAYTAGVNNYINALREDEYPLEYKLLNYKPEPWTNLKTALFMKYMAFDLALDDDDFEMTNAKSIFTKAQFEKLFPYGQDSVKTIHPKGIVFAKPGIKARKPDDADSLYFNYKDSVLMPSKPVKPDPDNGSNNWAVDSSRTQSKSPILCNDPHLGLNLPSLWFEIQISTPTFNAYGVSFPGAPSIVIGFNDSCAWGVTNASRDVEDFYEIQFKDAYMRQYLYNGEWRNTTFRNEVIKIKGAQADTEKIAITVWGPVMYDMNYPNKLNYAKAYANRWKAHDASNELKAFLSIDHAKNYNDYLNTIIHLQCPGQNFVFATKKGDIAIKQQGDFPAKWKGQGDFIMPGNTDKYAWQGIIPDSENIIRHNPESGYVSSANQYPYDTTYPYYMGGSYEPYRGTIIKRKLGAMRNITTKDMQLMQTDNFNIFAEMAKKVLLKNINEDALNTEEKKYLSIFRNWNLRNDSNEQGPSIFTSWWDSLMAVTYNDEMAQSKLPMPEVEHSTLLESLLKDSAYEFSNDITTPQKETTPDMVLKAFRLIIPGLKEAEKNNTIAWGKFKNTGIRHLLKIPALSRYNLITGGGNHIINATKQFHGPSWRMIVQLTNETEAYGIYPGGQSGNPGSKYYANFISDWAAGKYYKIKIQNKENFDGHHNGKLTFSKS